MKKATLAAFAAAMISGSVMAETGSIGLGLGYGLLSGSTLQGTYVISPSFQARAALSTGMDMSGTATSGDWNYDTKQKNGQKRLALDWHPFEGSFFVSAGYAINDMTVEGNALQTANNQVVTIGDQTYTVNGSATLKAQLNFNNAPTLSFGWGNSPEKGFGFMTELGVMFTGSPTSTVTGTGSVQQGANVYDLSNDPTIKAEIEKERVKAQKSIAEATMLLIIQAGLTYRF